MKAIEHLRADAELLQVVARQLEHVGDPAVTLMTSEAETVDVHADHIARCLANEAALEVAPAGYIDDLQQAQAFLWEATGSHDALLRQSLIIVAADRVRWAVAAAQRVWTGSAFNTHIASA